MRSFFWQKKLPPSANAEFFGKKKKALPSANAEGKKPEKKFVGSESRTQVHNFAVHHSTHYSIPLSMVDELKIVDINKLKIFFSS